MDQGTIAAKGAPNNVVHLIQVVVTYDDMRTEKKRFATAILGGKYARELAEDLQRRNVKKVISVELQGPEGYREFLNKG